MSSVLIVIAQAIETRLKKTSVQLDGVTKTPPIGLTVLGEMTITPTARMVEHGPLINVSFPQEVKTSRDHWKSPHSVRVGEVILQIWANSDATRPSLAVDPAYLWTIHALQSDPTLGGINNFIAEEGSEGGVTAFTDSETLIAVREVKIQYHFHTKTNDPETRS
jgi:hypothetical protein